MTTAAKALLATLLLQLALPGLSPDRCQAAEPAVAVTAAAPAAVAAKDAPLPEQYGMALQWGYAYDPSPNPTYLLATGFAIYDYGAAWRMKNCPNTLRLKFEGTLGSTLNPEGGLVASVNMLALKYPLGLREGVRPYGEAGIGVIYTQYRVAGQGLHVNFNPLLGAGLEFPQPDGRHLFAAIRASHISNAQLHRDNRGVNALLLQVGRMF